MVTPVAIAAGGGGRTTSKKSRCSDGLGVAAANQATQSRPDCSSTRTTRVRGRYGPPGPGGAASKSPRVAAHPIGSSVRPSWASPGERARIATCSRHHRTLDAVSSLGSAMPRRVWRLQAVAREHAESTVCNPQPSTSLAWRSIDDYEERDRDVPSGRGSRLRMPAGWCMVPRRGRTYTAWRQLAFLMPTIGVCNQALLNRIVSEAGRVTSRASPPSAHRSDRSTAE